MEKKQTYVHSSQTVDQILMKAMLEGEYPPGSTLPPERELAASLGIARTTLRESLQRLARDKWLTIRKGQPALVNHYWQEGNLNTLENIIANTDEHTEDFVVHLLEVRSALAPAFVRDAVLKNPAKVIAVLAKYDELEDSPDSFTQFDWNLQKQLAILSGNPIYILLINSFSEIYGLMGKKYFSHVNNRESTHRFYARLLAAAMSTDALQAEQITKEDMLKSIELWKSSMS
ncbi:fatty acid metabolism transcriptional regulator FadR [Chengkuizengella axinellae]|uniref:Fatty acid metabolism transcriptional regulator FadR n=1 Tax=Chengkuizengella axinellae TaxID=3064388 RepID=A0ABT9IXR0_9BACL|nr:fatty acid metabolism transcriptional regulator FadR [Chengkuizengella sp. 2205SS18-9]MDP5274149.1 fatty acid metabolism transcriptional regulator FadR [Chengkuizengella sp. 2205SS18-9]